MTFSVEISIEKNGRREKYYQNKRAKRWRVTWCGVSLLLTLFPIQLADRLTGLTKENFEHNGSTIKYLKSPSVDAGDFPTQTDWLSNSDEQIHVKNAVVKAEAKTVAYLTHK
jgi:hypothetical protein